MFTSLYYKHCNYSIICKIQNDMQIIFDDYIDDEIDNLNGILSTLIFEIINGNLLRI